MRLIKGLVTVAVAAALLVIPASVLAKRDRDHDRMPDKWELKNHLNPRVNDARKDPDHDGLDNLAEFRHHTNPHRADTDRDGIKDGTEVRDDTNPNQGDDANELSGTIVSFDNGVLTIQPAVAGASTVSGTVNDTTRIECDNEQGDDDTTAPAPTTAQMSDHGSDDNSGPGGGDDGDRSGTSGSGSDNSGPGSTSQGDDDQGDAGDDDNANDQCTTADLKPGAAVHEAKTATATDGSTVFTKIELVPAA
jgi:hypothetical protein